VDIEVADAVLACAVWDRGADITLVHFHGNGEVVADWEDVFPNMTESLGVNLLLAEYRGYGGSTGTPQMGRMLDDVDAIADYLEGAVVVFGRSVGSIYAIEYAHRHPVRGVILESGIADVRQRIALRATPAELGVSPQEFDEAFDDRLNHERKLGEIDAPVLILHTENDHLVGVDHAHANAEWAAGEVTKVIFDRGDHNSIYAYNRQAYERAISQFSQAL
jgi:pimeloyl-ACP methyl ester carboxylesterase